MISREEDEMATDLFKWNYLNEHQLIKIMMEKSKTRWSQGSDAFKQ